VVFVEYGRKASYSNSSGGTLGFPLEKVAGTARYFILWLHLGFINARKLVFSAGLSFVSSRGIRGKTENLSRIAGKGQERVGRSHGKQPKNWQNDG